MKLREPVANFSDLCHHFTWQNFIKKSSILQGASVNTHIASESLEITVVSKESYDQILRGPDGDARTITLIAKHGNSEVEIGRAWLHVSHEQKVGSQALFYIQEISTLAPDMELVKIVLLEKARDLFPKHNIVVPHDGKIPEGIEGLEPFDSGISILVPG